MKPFLNGVPYETERKETKETRELLCLLPKSRRSPCLRLAAEICQGDKVPPATRLRLRRASP